MIEGARWKRWVNFRLPLGMFIIVLLFPFYWMAITAVRPDGELYRPWNARNYTPFWTWNPTLAHIRLLFEETLFSTGGSSQNVHVALMTAVQPGEPIVLARNGHKSVFAGLVLAADAGDEGQIVVDLGMDQVVLLQELDDEPGRHLLDGRDLQERAGGGVARRWRS